jgi:hypothetical protein
VQDGDDRFASWGGHLFLYRRGLLAGSNGNGDGGSHCHSDCDLYRCTGGDRNGHSNPTAWAAAGSEADI